MPEEHPLRPVEDAPASARVSKLGSPESPIVRVDISLAPGGLRARIADQRTDKPPPNPQSSSARKQRPRRAPNPERAELERRRAQLTEEAARLDARARGLAHQAQALAGERASLTIEREQLTRAKR